MNRITAWLWNLPIVVRVVERSKRTSLIGFEGLAIYTVLDFFIKEIRKEHLNTKSTSLAFSFFLAIFPATIFLFTLIPYIPVNHFQDQLLSILGQVLPANAYEAVQTTLTDIIKNKNGGLLSFGFLAALFFSSNGLMALMRNFNKASLVSDKRPGWKKRRTAIVLTVVISIMLIVGVSLIIAGNFIVNKLDSLEIIHGALARYSLLAVNWIIILLLFFSIISTLYYFGPASAKKQE